VAVVEAVADNLKALEDSDDVEAVADNLKALEDSDDVEAVLVSASTREGVVEEGLALQALEAYGTKGQVDNARSHPCNHQRERRRLHHRSHLHLRKRLPRYYHKIGYRSYHYPLEHKQ
jgi:hypothetical protein